MSFVSSVLFAIQARWSGSLNGSLWISSVFTTLKTVQLAPTPSPAIKIAKIANALSRRSVRSAYFTSWFSTSRNGNPRLSRFSSRKVSRPPTLRIACRRASCGFIPDFSYSAVNRSRCASSPALNSSSISDFDQIARTFAHNTRIPSPVTCFLSPSPLPLPPTIQPRPCRGAALLRPRSAQSQNLGTRWFCPFRSLAFLCRCKKPRDHRRKLLPVLRRFGEPLRSPRSDRIKLRLSVVFRYAPFGLDQPTLLQ